MQQNGFWMIGIVLMALALGVLQYFGFGDVVAMAADLGVIFLILTLLPIGIMRLRFSFLTGALPTLAWLSSHRRDFGILCGLLFVIHGASAYSAYRDVTPSLLFTKSILPGTIAMVVILIMLLTSSRFVQQKLTWWRGLHQLIWFILPLASLHAASAALEYLGSAPTLAPMSFSVLIFFVLFEFVLAKIRRIPVNGWHLVLTALGVATAVLTQVI